MGRRKKEPPSAHREKIAAAAAQLFQSRGFTATSMDDIAQKAGYSKATLYVYFANKQEIIGLLALKSMQQLYARLQQALSFDETATMPEKYQRLCQGLRQYQQEQPLYFQMVLNKINGAPDNEKYSLDERAAYQTGEAINDLIRDCLQTGIANGELREDLPILPTIFSLWGMLAGFIQLAANKQEYIAATMQQSPEEFLEYGFQMLYRSIARCPNPNQEV